MSRTLTYGFVGLGQMGGPMASHVPNAVVYDTRPEAVEPLVAKGAKAAAGLAELAASCDLISVIVRDDAQVEEVFAAMSEALRPGTVIAVHATIRPRTAEALADRARPLGVEVVDAPISGSVFGAAAGTLAVMVGGSEEAFARVKEPFGFWSGLVLHVGQVGAGTKAKLARNLLQYIGFAAAAESQRLAEAAGISLRRLGRIVRHSDSVSGGPGSVILRPTTAPMSQDDPLYEVMEHAAALGEKDLGLAFELAGELGVDLPLARMAFDRLAAGLGLPEPDAAAEAEAGQSPDPGAQDGDEEGARRRRGLEMMGKVYGWGEVGDAPHDEFFGMTADHLFGDIWTRPGLSMRDRRLMLIGLVAGQGLDDVLSMQIPAALGNGELSSHDLREVVIFLTHYIGWPLGARLNTQVEKAIAQRERAQAKGSEPS